MSNAVTTVLKRGESLREQTSVIEMTRYLSSRAAAHATFDFSLLSTPSSLFTPPTMKYYLCLAVEKEYPSNKNGRERERARQPFHPASAFWRSDRCRGTPSVNIAMAIKGPRSFLNFSTPLLLLLLRRFLISHPVFAR